MKNLWISFCRPNKTKQKIRKLETAGLPKKPLEPFTLLPSPITLSVPEFSNLTFFCKFWFTFGKKEMAMTGYYIAAKTSLSRSSELITLGAGLTDVMTAYCRSSWYILGGVHYSVPESTECLWWKYPFSTLKIFYDPTQKVNFISSK